jgi:hypothetical protein
LVVVLAVAIGISVATGGRGDRGSALLGSPTATAAPGRPAVAPSSPTQLPPVRPLTPTELPLSQAPAAALQTAASWSAAWVNHPEGTTTQQWLAGLRPYTTDEYLGVLGNVDPGNVPATRVTGPPTPTRVSPSSVQVKVPTDTLTLVVLVVDTDAGWRVAGYDRA